MSMLLQPALLKRVEVAGMRLYETPEKNYYPSITTILGRTISEEKEQSLKSWQNSLGASNAKAYTEAAASKGTNVHLMIERFLKNEDLRTKEFSAFDVNVFTALKLKLKQISDLKGLELPLYSDLLEVAGTCDCVGTYKGIPSIIDFKTSCRIKSEKDIADYKLQCLFYGIAVNEKHGTDIDQGVILMSAQTGFPLEFTFKLSDFLPELIQRIDLFYSNVNSRI
jgi:hypothetical protein